MSTTNESSSRRPCKSAQRRDIPIGGRRLVRDGSFAFLNGTIDFVDESEEREVRQLTLMKDVLGDFAHGGTSIGAAVNTLKSLFWQLENVSDGWRAEFHGDWLYLEIENASALEEGSRLPDATVPLLRDAVARMLKMVTDQLSFYSES
jgi:hypothetical protein